MVRKFNLSRKMTASSTSKNLNSKHSNSRNASASVGGCSAVDSDVSEKRDVSFFEADAKSPESSSPDGRKFPEKALKFWADKAPRRKMPHHCNRCGKPHRGGGQCPACKTYAAKYRARKRAALMPQVEPKTIASLEKRVANLENYFANLSTLRRMEYKRGYCAGRRLHRKAQERASYFDALPTASRQELAEISHEYAR